jgi:hypothetical protein
MLASVLSIIVMILGLIIFLAADKYPDLKQIGLWMMVCGLLVTLLMFGGNRVRIP